MTTGVIFNIQRFSIHDGPGIRTTVFLKGCSLRCFWCHNPEGVYAGQEVLFFPERCIGDAECARLCPQGAHLFTADGHRYNRTVCKTCGQCVEVCYAGALELTGRMMTVDAVVEEVLRDRAFYETSGGGVTLSGGDPMVQREFSRQVLLRCREAGLHTAVETAGNCRWEDLAELLVYTDLVMMDLKQMDPEAHRQATGVSNRLILANARRIVEAGKPVLFRTPVVPGVNDTPAAIAAIAAFVAGLAELRPNNPPALELLPFHPLAGGKYRGLGQVYRAHDLPRPSREQMESLAQAARGRGIVVHCRN